jgi:prophage regulatory protein
MESQDLPQTGFVRLPRILAVFPVSRSTWWAGVKSGKYPQAVHLGANTTAWRAEDIRALISKHSNPAKTEATAD